MAIIPRWQTPISRWSLDGNANDLYGLYNGTASNMTYSTDAKEKGLSGSFSLSPVGYVDLSGLSLSSYDNFTMSIWVKCTSSGEMYLTHERVGSPDYRTAIVIRSGNLIRILTYVDSTFYLVDSNVAIDRYVWNHIVVTFSGSSTASVSVYLNGQIYKTGSLKRYPSYQATAFYLGGYEGSTTSKLVGLMDDVRLYDVALTADEVMNLYKSYATPIWNQPLHRWKLDGNAIDSAGNINGTAVGTVVYSSSQKVSGNYSMLCDGGADYIDLGTFRFYEHTNFSIALWFKISGTGIKCFLSDSYTATQNEVRIVSSDGIIYYQVINNAGGPFSDRTDITTYNDDKWHHIVICDANGTVTSYIDGVTSTIAGTYTRVAITLDHSSIGATRYSSGTYYNGFLNDVRFYDVALSAADVKALYNSYFTEKAVNFISSMV